MDVATEPVLRACRELIDGADSAVPVALPSLTCLAVVCRVVDALPEFLHFLAVAGDAAYDCHGAASEYGYDRYPCEPRDRLAQLPEFTHNTPLVQVRSAQSVIRALCDGTVPLSG